jgi:hypothetical protein
MQRLFDTQFAAGIALASEISKQLITVASALIAVGVTFGNSVARNVRPKDLRVLYSAWISYFLTIVFAVWHLSALTGALIPATPQDSLRLESAHWPALLQLFAFVIANLLLVIFGFAAVRAKRTKAVPWLTTPDQTR